MSFFSLLLNILFRDSKRYSHWSNSIQWGGIPSKKSSRRLVDNEIFLTHSAKSCLIIYNKCIVIYYKIVGEGQREVFLVSLQTRQKLSLWGFNPPPLHADVYSQQKNSHRLVAQETKRYFFKGVLMGVTPSKKSFRLLVANETEIFLWGFTIFVD